MKERTHPDNGLWILCCCGCLPVLGMIKGIIIVFPIFLISLIGFTGVAIVLLPHDVFLTYKAICKTSIIGINIKIMTILLLPIAFVAWPILVAFVGSLFGIFYGLFCPTIRTFDSEYDIIYGGVIDVFTDVFYYMRRFWYHNYNTYFSYLFEMEKRKVNEPFDISVIQMIIGLLLAGYGSTIGVIVCTLLWLIKLIPSIFKLYKLLFKAYCKLECLWMFMLFLLFIVAFALVPVIAVLAILGYVGFGIYAGIYCAIEGYKHNIKCGLISIWDNLRLIDGFTNKFIFECNYSLLPDCRKMRAKKEKPVLFY